MLRCLKAADAEFAGGCVVALVELWSQMTRLWTHFPLPAIWLQQTLLVLISDPAHLPVPLNIKWWRAANSLHLWPTVEYYPWLTRLWDHYHSWYHCHSLPSPQWVRLRLSLSPHPVRDRLSWRVVGTCSWISVLASASRKPNTVVARASHPLHSKCNIGIIVVHTF